MDKKIRNFLLALFIIAFLLKAYYLDKVPFQFDETLYSEMISEEAGHLSFIPTYMGMWAPWKPGLYFIVYSFFLPITSHLFTSLEWIYRSPNLLFGAINAFLFYLIAKRFLKDETALAAALLFYFSCSAFYDEMRLLIEVFTMTMILASIFFYTDKKMLRLQRFAGAALFAFLAALSKFVIALMIIPLALAFFFQNDRKNLGKADFLVSLLAAPIGIVFFAFMLSKVGHVGGVFFGDVGKYVAYNPSERAGQNLVEAFVTLLAFFGLYFVMSFRKMLSSWRSQIFFSLWLILAIIPSVSGEPQPWFFYYIAPALCFFAASSLEEKGKLDAFSLLVISIIFLSNIALIFYFGPVPFTPPPVYESRDIGLSLSGKENVLFIGEYYPITTAISYKILSERQHYGSYLDIGYVIYEPDLEKDGGPSINSVANSIVADYNSPIPILDREFAAIFWEEGAFRKNTSITKFDYVVISPANTTLSNPEYELEFNGTTTAVYKRK